MLRLVRLLTRLFGRSPAEDKMVDSSVGEGLSDFERRAIGDPMFSRDGREITERDIPRFASMVMPPYL